MWKLFCLQAATAACAASVARESGRDLLAQEDARSGSVGAERDRQDRDDRTKYVRASHRYSTYPNSLHHKHSFPLRLLPTEVQ